MTKLLHADEYFATARERYRIKLHRDSGGSPPYTKDPHFAEWRFCNVFREDDKTTVWFRENVRTKARDVVLATVIFRWFNRIETGEKILDLLVGKWDTEEARRRLQNVSPVVTGAYIIKGPDGYSKLDGVLYCIDAAIPEIERLATPYGGGLWYGDNITMFLEEAWNDLLGIYYLGRFMAYEIVSDLRWTGTLACAPDIMTWANAGPGCARGLGWVTEDEYNPGSKIAQKLMLSLMQELLAMSQDPVYWPTEWPKWEMREVEHWACEFDKYKRAESGDRLKRRFA